MEKHSVVDTDAGPASRGGDRASADGLWLAAEPVRLLPLLQMVSVSPLLACLGLTEEGQPLLLRLAAPDVRHLLIAGCEGAGKTELIRAIAVALALTHRQARLQLAVIDPGSQGLLPLSGLPHLVADRASDTASALALLDRLVGLADRRRRESFAWPHIIVALDEMHGLLSTGGLAAEAALLQLAQSGPSAGIHLLAGVADPARLPQGLQASFPARCVGRVADAFAAAAGAGRGGTGAESLHGQGDFILVASGQTLRFQAAWLPAHDWPVVGRWFERRRKTDDRSTTKDE